MAFSAMDTGGDTALLHFAAMEVNLTKVAVHDFLEEVQLTKQDKTWRGYKIALKYFQELWDKTHLENIQRIDLLRFSAFLRDKKSLRHELSTTSSRAC